VDKVKQLIHEGNVRRIVIKQGDRPIAEFPLTAGLVGAVFAPVLAAVGALAALVTDCSIAVEREQWVADGPDDSPSDPDSEPVVDAVVVEEEPAEVGS
jgi:hypothetical protein